MRERFEPPKKPGFDFHNREEDGDFRFKLREKALVVVDWANVYGWRFALGWKVDPKKLYDYLKTYPEITSVNSYFGVELDKPKSVAFKNRMESIGYSHKSKEVKFVPVYLETTKPFEELVRHLLVELDEAVTRAGGSSDLGEAKQLLYDMINSAADETSNDLKNAMHTKETYYLQKPPHREQVKLLDTLKEIQELLSEHDEWSRSLSNDLDDLLSALREKIQRRKCDFDVEITLDIIQEKENFGSLVLFSGDGDYKAICEHLLDIGKQVIVVHQSSSRGKEYKELLARKIDKPDLCAVEKLTPFLRK